MADWADCVSLKKVHPLLALCSHLANSGKHFEARASKHKSVASAKREGAFEPDVYEEGCYEESLQITLEPDAAKMAGTTNIDAVSLALKILEFWKSRLPSNAAEVT